MQRTFASEDNRKNLLFRAWIDYLTGIHGQYAEQDFEKFFEGAVVVSGVSRNRLDVRLEDGTSVRHIPITPEISVNSCVGDFICIYLGLREGKWLPLDVISIGSFIDFSQKEGRAHLTINPLICAPTLSSELTEH